MGYDTSILQYDNRDVNDEGHFERGWCRRRGGYSCGSSDHMGCERRHGDARANIVCMVERVSLWSLVGRCDICFLSNGLDGDCKKWRLFADFLNDGAMLLELLVPYVKDYSLQVLCATTSMKAIVSRGSFSCHIMTCAIKKIPLYTVNASAYVTLYR